MTVQKIKEKQRTCLKPRKPKAGAEFALLLNLSLVTRHFERQISPAAFERCIFYPIFLGHAKNVGRGLGQKAPGIDLLKFTNQKSLIECS